ncbi:hypothetical protein SK128_022351, partial [Halocaridina rubra]
SIVDNSAPVLNFFIMGKNKLNAANPIKSGNPIYKKAGGGAFFKAKNRTKPLKLNLKQIPVGNKGKGTCSDKKKNTDEESRKLSGVSSSGKKCKLSETQRERMVTEEKDNKMDVENTPELENV